MCGYDRDANKNEGRGTRVLIIYICAGERFAHNGTGTSCPVCHAAPRWDLATRMEAGYEEEM